MTSTLGKRSSSAVITSGGSGKAMKVNPRDEMPATDANKKLIAKYTEKGLLPDLSSIPDFLILNHHLEEVKKCDALLRAIAQFEKDEWEFKNTAAQEIPKDADWRYRMNPYNYVITAVPITGDRPGHKSKVVMRIVWEKEKRKTKFSKKAHPFTVETPPMTVDYFDSEGSGSRKEDYKPEADKFHTWKKSMSFHVLDSVDSPHRGFLTGYEGFDEGKKIVIRPTSWAYTQKLNFYVFTKAEELLFKRSMQCLLTAADKTSNLKDYLEEKEQYAPFKKSGEQLKDVMYVKKNAFREMTMTEMQKSLDPITEEEIAEAQMVDGKQTVMGRRQILINVAKNRDPDCTSLEFDQVQDVVYRRKAMRNHGYVDDPIPVVIKRKGAWVPAPPSLKIERGSVVKLKKNFTCYLYAAGQAGGKMSFTGPVYLCATAPPSAKIRIQDDLDDDDVYYGAEEEEETPEKKAEEEAARKKAEEEAVRKKAEEEEVARKKEEEEKEAARKKEEEEKNDTTVIDEDVDMGSPPYTQDLAEDDEDEEKFPEDDDFTFDT